MDEHLLPIDIHTNKLLDWLISRRHCEKSWQHSLTQIREQIKRAIEDMPEHPDIARILSGSQLNYYSCKKIVETLKETEADSKNMFGYYSSQRMKDWQDIIRAYEAESVYLAEAAQALIRNVNYEVPSLKKQVLKSEQAAEEYRKKQTEYVKQSNLLRIEYQSSAAKLGIQGEDVRKELTEQLKDFSKFMGDIFSKLPSLKEARDYYLEFLKFTTNMEDMECLPVLMYLLTNGNTTYYEFRKGEKPEVIEEFKIELSDDGISSSTQDDQQIDFGDGIDFGEETASSETTSGENGDFVHIKRAEIQGLNGNGTGNGTSDEINWDAIPSDEGADISLIDGSNDSKIAKGSDALSVLEYNVTRNLLLNELAELEGFLDQRLHELKMEGDILSVNQFQEAPAILQLSTSDTISVMTQTVGDIITAMSTEQMRMMYLMRDNPRYIDSLVQKMKRKTENGDTILLKAKVMAEKEVEVARERQALIPQIPVIIERTKQLQHLIEADISKRYKNRPVNIMGGVQVL
jgi:hypothetical protein